MGSVLTIARHLTVAAVFAVFAAPGVHAQASGTGRVLFTPAPLSTATAGFESGSVQPQTSATKTPTPRVRPSATNRPGKTPSAPLRTRLSKTDLDLSGHPLRTPSLAAPKPNAVDLTRGVDLGGVSLGLATGRDDGSSGGTGLVTLDTKTPIPSDPALATRQSIPYFGLSLSAPTN